MLCNLQKEKGLESLIGEWLVSPDMMACSLKSLEKFADFSQQRTWSKWTMLFPRNYRELQSLGTADLPAV